MKKQTKVKPFKPFGNKVKTIKPKLTKEQKISNYKDNLIKKLFIL